MRVLTKWVPDPFCPGTIDTMLNVLTGRISVLVRVNKALILLQTITSCISIDNWFCQLVHLTKEDCINGKIEKSILSVATDLKDVPSFTY